ncbi:phosphopantetheine-binding protein, partial [Streptomyces sp. NPDC020965]|uniref:phosphopantetheine-binding protein n=1 Tax=Streptomyces sp. NPDC020965 TaxID=3365105 RepID=UPI0037AD7409
RTVRFQDTVQALLESGHTTYLEVSPHPTLLPAVHGNTTASPVVCLPTLSRGHATPIDLLARLGDAYVHGLPLDWDRLGTERAESARGQVELPTYPFQHRRYWQRPGSLPTAGATPTRPPEPEEPADGYAAMHPADRERAVVALVHQHAAAILGHHSPNELDGAATFKQLGFDSLLVVRLCTALSAATGLTIPGATVFSHPTPRALGRLLSEQLAQSGTEQDHSSALAPRDDRPHRLDVGEIQSAGVDELLVLLEDRRTRKLQGSR